MKRPDHPTTTVDNRFTDGSAVGGVPSTTLPAYVFNQLYDEVTAVIEGYGLTLDGAQSNQLYQAIQDAIAAAVAAINVDLSALAPKNSPILTGTPTAPTAAAATNDGQLATTAFVHTLVTGLVGGAPGALDTLKELADALGDDANFASTVTTALALKAPLSSPALTGTPTAPTAAPTTATAQLATTAFVAAAIEALSSLFTSSLTDNGWSKRPDGLIEQWSRTNTAVGEGTIRIDFPMPFPTECLNVTGNIWNSGGSANTDCSLQIVSWDSTGVNCYYQYMGAPSSPTNPTGVVIRAIGH